jgi:hypothetical protein
MGVASPVRALIFYSPPLRRLAGQDVSWTYQTVLLGIDGTARLIPGPRDWGGADGRATCNRYLLAQIRVDREAASAGGADIAFVAVADANSWDDLKRAHDLPTHF